MRWRPKAFRVGTRLLLSWNQCGSCASAWDLLLEIFRNHRAPGCAATGTDAPRGLGPRCADDRPCDGTIPPSDAEFSLFDLVPSSATIEMAMPGTKFHKVIMFTSEHPGLVRRRPLVQGPLS
jgi:hypothetical protein